MCEIVELVSLFVDVLVISSSKKQGVVWSNISLA